MTFSEYKTYLLTALDNVDESEIAAFTDLLFDAWQRRAMVFVIGNGGSAASASHLAQDLAKGTCNSVDQEQRLRALSLTDNFAFASALGNDEGYESIFVQQLRTFCSSGDVLVSISGSGNSPNVLRAVEYARANGVATVGVTGFDGGKLREMVDHRVHVPLHDMCTAESIHTIIFHHIILDLRERIAESIRQAATA